MHVDEESCPEYMTDRRNLKESRTTRHDFARPLIFIHNPFEGKNRANPSRELKKLQATSGIY